MTIQYIKIIFLGLSILSLSSCNYFKEKEERIEREQKKIEQNSTFKKIFEKESKKYEPYTIVKDEDYEGFSYELEEKLVEGNKVSLIKGVVLGIQKKDSTTYIIHVNYKDSYPLEGQGQMFHLEADRSIVNKIKYESRNGMYDSYIFKNKYMFFVQLKSVKLENTLDTELWDYEISEDKELDSYEVSIEEKLTNVFRGKVLSVLDPPGSFSIKDIKE